NAALVQLSEEGRRRLAESKHSWVKYRRDASKLDVHYLKGIYDSRTRQLEQTLRTAGPFKVQSLTVYDKAKQAAREQTTASVFTRDSLEFSFPRIESPSTAETERWNRLVEEHIREFAGQPEPHSDVEVSFEITYASQDIISLLLEMTSSAAGTAHPSHDRAGYNVLL